MRWRDDNAIGKMFLSIPVVNQDRPRDHWRRRDAGVFLDDRLYSVARQHFQRGALGRPGKGVCVLTHIQRAVGALTLPIVANGLGDRQNVRLGKRTAQRRAAMPTGTEADRLGWICRVGAALVILALKLRQIDEHFLGSWLASQWRNCHVSYPLLKLSREPRGTVPPSRCRPHIQRSCGRWRI